MEESGGYDYDVADDGVYDEFYCPICTKLKRDAMELQCEHSLCSTCLDQWEKKAREMKLEFNCVECRGPIDKTMAQRSGTVNRMIKTSIRVKCLNTPEGCQWIGVVLDIEEHLQKKCNYAIVPCEHEACPERLQRINLNTHLLKCIYQTTPCEYCGIDVLMINMQNHLMICNLFPVQCENKGCAQTSTRESIGFHYSNECRFRTIDCQYASIGCTVKMLQCVVDDHEKDFTTRHMSLMFRNTVSLREELTDTKQRLTKTEKILQYSTDFEVSFFMKSIREKLATDLEELEKLVDEASLRAGSFNMEIADHLTNPPDQGAYKSVLNMYLDLHYIACKVMSAYDIKRYKGVQEVLTDLALPYGLTENHVEYLYKNGIEAGCSDLMQKYEKLCGIHKTVDAYIDKALNSVDVLRDCVERSLKMHQIFNRGKYMSVAVKIKNLENIDEWKLNISIRRSSPYDVKVLSVKKIIEVYASFVNEAVVLKPLWNVAVKLNLEKKNDNSFSGSFPVKDLVADGCTNYLETLFIVFARDIDW